MIEATPRIYEELSEHLKRIKGEGRYRRFAELQRHCGTFPKALWYTGSREKTDVTIWCSNDYLGMGQHPKVLAAMQEALTRYGAGSGGTRNIAGNHHALVDLEAELADLHGKQSALVFTSGYIANEATLSTIGRLLQKCVVFSDSQNHASMIQGIRQAGCQKIIFRHNDVSDLKRRLETVPKNIPKVIAFESVYSMDGDIGPIEDFVELARSYNALTYLDEVHAVGLYGPQGGGVAESLNLHRHIDIIQGTLAKAFGLQGGYIAGDHRLVDCVRSFAPGFIFTTSLSPVIACGALASIRHLRVSQHERQELHKRSRHVKDMLKSNNFRIIDCESHIVPLMINDAELCRKASDHLLHKHAIYIQPINFPTVPRKSERLRITPGPAHTQDMVEHLIEALDETRTALNLQSAINQIAG